MVRTHSLNKFTHLLSHSFTQQRRRGALTNSLHYTQRVSGRAIMLNSHHLTYLYSLLHTFSLSYNRQRDSNYNTTCSRLRQLINDDGWDSNTRGTVRALLLLLFTPCRRYFILLLLISTQTQFLFFFYLKYSYFLSVHNTVCFCWYFCCWLDCWCFCWLLVY